MRITEGIIYQSARTSTARAREAAEAAQAAASSGSRIRHPGDDPAGSAQLVAFNLTSDRFTAIAKATGSASDELTQADSSLSTVNDALSRARVLAMQFSSSSYDSTQAAGAAEEVKGLIGQVVSAMNTRFGDRYIFGGTKDDAPPFDSAGNYSGDSGVRQVEVAPGALQQTNVQADRFVKGQGVAGGTDVFAVLTQLESALTTYDPAAVQATLPGLDQATSQVSAATAQANSAKNALDTGTTAAKAVATQAQQRSAKVGEVDIIEASIQLQSTQTALQATLQAIAKSFQLSLLDYLK